MNDSQRRLKILIVDDDPSLLEALERAFIEAGEDVTAHGSPWSKQKPARPVPDR